MVTQCDPELTLLTITNLDLSYPGDEPLATISWQVERGDQIALLGRSGTGKSTLLAAIIEGSPAIIKEVNALLIYLNSLRFCHGLRLSKTYFSVLSYAETLSHPTLPRKRSIFSARSSSALMLIDKLRYSVEAKKPESPLHAYYSNNQIWYYWMNRSRVSIARHASKWLHSVRHYLPAKQSF